MRDTINHFLYLNDFNWRESPYQWFFYAGILLILIFERRKMLRIVFGWLPLLFLVSIFNPVCLKLLNLADLYNQAYFTRLFSFMPLTYVIAYGFSLLIRITLRFRNEWIKLAGVGVVCGLICLSGHNIYKESWLVKAENPAKVPQDTFEIIDAIKEEEQARIAPIDYTSIYLRQACNAITPYGRYMGELGYRLSDNPPDVQLVMEMAGQQDVDYIVVHRNDETIAAFAENNYRPWAQTNNYLLYKVEGVKRVRREINAKHQVLSAANYSPEGEMEETESGYASVHYEYDANQNKAKESYTDQYGKAFLFPEGYSSIVRTYYINGRIRTDAYQDPFGNPIMVDGRYKTKYGYNRFGQIVRETYYDQNGKRISEVGVHKAKEPTCLKYIHKTSGARKDAENGVTFETQKEGNRFSAVWFQLYDAITDEIVATFGEIRETGNVQGEYIHQSPSGLYRLVFRGNTNLADEYIQSLEYISEGEVLHYGYSVEEFSEKRVQIKDFHIGKEDEGGSA